MRKRISLLVTTKAGSHCYFIRLNPRKKETVWFCLPVLLGIHRNSKQKELFRSTQGFLRQSNLSTWKNTWMELGTKITERHFYSASKEDIWPNKISDSMQGLKSAILTILHRGPGWPCPVSVALKNPSLDLKISFCFMFLWTPSNAGSKNLKVPFFLGLNLVK